MSQEEKVKCPWCSSEEGVDLKKERSDYADIIVRRCKACGKIISSYLDEDRVVLERVRTFKNI